MAKHKLYSGDTISLTIGVNMPVRDDRGSPWVKVEASGTTTIRQDETHKAAKERLSGDVYTRLDRILNRMVKEVLKGSEA